MGKLEEQIARLEEKVAEEDVNDHLVRYNAEQRDIGLMILGGVRVLGNYASIMSSDAFKALIRFGDEKLYLAFGYNTFAEFLNECPQSPMTKTQFYARKSLFDSEGERMFDLFGDLGLSIRKRKLLGKGNVEIDGETAIIHNVDGEDVTIELTDRTRLLETLTALADGNAEKNIKIDRQKATIDSQKATIQNAHDDLDKVKASKIAATASNPHMIARVELGIAFRKLAEAAEQISGIEKEQFRDAVFEDIAAWRFDLAAAYATATPTQKGPVELKGDDFDEQLDNFLNNDADLADAL